MEHPVFKELLTVLPDWSARLRVFSARYPVTVEPVNSRKRGPSVSDDEGTEKVTTVVGPHPIRPSADEVKPKEMAECPPPPKQMSKMSAKPAAPKMKFSAINGPSIYYDGEAQTALFECWTTLNAKRGLLRKEMMGIRRKKIMSLPAANYGYSDDDESDGEEAEAKPKETPEQLQARLAEEKRKAEEERRKAEREKKSAEVLEFIDSCLDKAAKGCENAAFLWLKGEACSGHVNFIAGRMGEAVDRINLEIAKASQPEKVEVEAEEDDDEGLGADVDMEDVDQPLFRKMDERQQRIARPIRRATDFVA